MPSTDESSDSKICTKSDSNPTLYIQIYKVFCVIWMKHEGIFWFECAYFYNGSWWNAVFLQIKDVPLFSRIYQFHIRNDNENNSYDISKLYIEYPLINTKRFNRFSKWISRITSTTFSIISFIFWMSQNNSWKACVYCLPVQIYCTIRLVFFYRQFPTASATRVTQTVYLWNVSVIFIAQLARIIERVRHDIFVTAKTPEIVNKTDPNDTLTYQNRDRSIIR